MELETGEYDLVSNAGLVYIVSTVTSLIHKQTLNFEYLKH